MADDKAKDDNLQQQSTTSTSTDSDNIKKGLISMKVKRSSAKRLFTLSRKTLDTLCSQSKSVGAINGEMLALKTRYDKLVDIHTDILVAMAENDLEPSEQDYEYIDAPTLECNLAMANAREVLEQLSPDSTSDKADSDSKVKSCSDDTKSSVMPAVKCKQIEMSKFSNNIRDYPAWIHRFKTYFMEQYGRHAGMMLKDSLSGTAAEITRGLDDSDVYGILEVLDARFGNRQKLLDSVMSDLERLPVSNGTLGQLREMVHTIQIACTDLKAVDLEAEIQHSSTVKLIERRLPRHLKDDWAKIKMEANLAPNNMFARLKDFLQSALLRAEDVMTMGACENLDIEDDWKLDGQARGAQYRPPGSGGMGKDQCPLHEYAEAPHYLSQCRKFRRLSVDEKLRIMENEAKNFCRACLRPGHRFCNTSSVKCYHSNCNLHHFTFMHDLCVNSYAEAGSAYRATSQDPRMSISPAQIVEFRNESGHIRKVNTLWDSGSNLTLVLRSICTQLSLHPIDEHPTKLCIETVGGARRESLAHRFKLSIVDASGHGVHEVIAYAVDKIGALEEVNIDDAVKMFGLCKSDQDAIRYPIGTIGLLLGSDNAQLVLHHVCEVDGLRLSESVLGKLVWGHHSSFASVKSSARSAVSVRIAINAKKLSKRTEVDQEVRSLFSTEAMGVSCVPKCGRCSCGKCQIDGGPLSLQERFELEQILSSMTLENGVITASYPFRKDITLLPDNFELASRRLQQIEKKLGNNFELAQQYQQQFTEMLEKGTLRKLSADEILTWQGPVQYLPHNYVLKSSSTSTPCRLIFDPSSPYKGHAVNDYWVRGPNLINGIFGVTIRFRENLVAVYADIKKMYHTVRTRPSEWHLHRVLWRDLETSRAPDVYVITCNSFGSGPAGAVAIAALQYLAKRSIDELPRGANSILHQSYVDDITDSIGTYEEALQLSKDVDYILNTGGFRVKGWTIVDKTSRGISQADSSGRDCVDDDPESILGLYYDRSKDEFYFDLKLNFSAKRRGAKVGPNLSPGDIHKKNIVPKLTKKMILSQVNSIYDPLGILAPFTVELKFGLGKLWRHKTEKDMELDWNDPIPDEHDQHWRELFDKFHQARKVSIPRSLSHPDGVEKPILIAFSDSSMIAFGACCYIRWELSTGSCYSTLVAAKSRMWPINPSDYLTVCRGELQGAVLAARLASSIVRESRFVFAETIFVTDSEIVHAQINMDSHLFNVFTGNRIAEIVSTTLPSQWYVARTDQNYCADLLSRGTDDFNLLTAGSTWQTGPRWLHLPRTEWPIHQERDSKVTIPEMKSGAGALKTRTMMIQSNEYPNIQKPEGSVSHIFRCIQRLGEPIWQDELNDALLQAGNLRHFSMEQKLYIAAMFDLSRRDSLDFWLRVTYRILAVLSWKPGDELSLIQRFLKPTVVSASQRQTAKIFWIQVAQESIELKIQSGAFKTLTPFKDADGIIRCNGRAGISTHPGTYQPILLPHEHPISRLLVIEFHRRGHGGATTTAAKVRSEYHIIRLRSLAQVVRNDCQLCKRVEHVLMKAPMGSLPMSRILPSFPFENASCDLFGCFQVKLAGYLTRARKVDPTYAKAYGLIVTCLSTRAIHLEIMHGQSTESFLLAFRRFVCMRGQPKTMYSDCGSQLIAADGELRDIVKDFDLTQLHAYGAANGMRWSYSSPGSPWQNGVSEALIKSVKKTLNTITDAQTRLPILELQTILYEVAQILNERPINLGHQGASGSDYDSTADTYLCPNQLLLGRCSVRIPHVPDNPDQITNHERILANQTVVADWWARWSAHYYPTLIHQSKWYQASRHAQVGDIVHIRDLNPVRGNYNIGEIIEIRPNASMIPRDVLVRYKVAGNSKDYRPTTSKTQWRDVKNLVLLLPAEKRSELNQPDV